MQEAHKELWEKVKNFQLDDENSSLTFSKRLARENRWTEEYTARVIEEYKKFMFLGSISEFSVTPSDEVDQVWHLHMIYTRSYWDELCGEILKKKFHHGPTKGGHKEGKRFRSAYNDTKAFYAFIFGHQPPEDIWPSTKVRFSQDFKRINVSRNWVIPKPSKKLANALSIIAIFMAALLFIRATTINTGLLIFFIIAAAIMVFLIIKAIINSNKRSTDSRIHSAYMKTYQDYKANNISLTSNYNSSSSSKSKKKDSSDTSTSSGCGMFFGCSSSSSSSSDSGCGSSGCGSSGCGGGGCGGCGG